MGARQKLNCITIQGCLIVGGVMGLVCQSWLVLIITSMVLIGSSLACGDIRPNRHGPAGPRPTRRNVRRQQHQRRPPSRRR